MNLLKRLSTTITSNFDWAISQIENHEQLIQTAIRDVQTSAQKARIQLARVSQDGNKMSERLHALEQEVESWKNRAVQSADKDRSTALECLKRKQRAEAEYISLTEQYKEHQVLKARLAADLERIATQLDVLKRKKNVYSARQSSARATTIAAAEDLSVLSDVSEIFERWDMKIAECETLLIPVDSFAEAFESKEENEALEKELSALLDNKNNK